MRHLVRSASLDLCKNQQPSDDAEQGHHEFPPVRRTLSAGGEVDREDRLVGSGIQGSVVYGAYGESQKPCMQKTGAERTIRHEAAMLQRLNHASIPKVLGVAPIHESWTLYETRAPGYPLGALVGKHRDTPTPEVLAAVERLLKPFRTPGDTPLAARQHLARQVVGELVQVLRHCGARRVVHRDLKPHNVLLNPAPEADAPSVYLVDFGLAAEIGGDINPQHGPSGFMSPLQTATANPDDDVWMLGSLMYALITGFPPFADQIKTDDGAALLYKAGAYHHFGSAGPTWPPAVPADARAFFAACCPTRPSTPESLAKLADHPWLTSDKAVRLSPIAEWVAEEPAAGSVPTEEAAATSERGSEPAAGSDRAQAAVTEGDGRRK